MSPDHVPDVPKHYPTVAELRKSNRISAAYDEMQAEEDAEEHTRLQRHRDRIALRLADGRSRPVMADTMEEVVIERPVQKRQKRLLATASKFKGTRYIADMLQMAPAVEEPPKEIAVDRMLAWRLDAQVERARRAVPSVWEARAVDLWLQAAYETLFRLPTRIWPKEYGNCMPTPSDFADLTQADINAQVLGRNDEEPVDPPPLFGLARLKTLGQPDEREHARMEEALSWPTTFLLMQPEMARAVGHAAMWAALEIEFSAKDFKKTCHRRFGVSPTEFDRMRGAGLVIIAGGLNASSKRPTR